MKRRLQIDPDALALKYIAQLEADLKLERERVKIYRSDVEFYRGKCEKLELAILESATGSSAAGESYVRRAEPKRPSIGQVKLEGALRPKFQELRQRWDALTAAQQEQVMKTGQWDLEKEVEVPEPSPTGK